MTEMRNILRLLLRNLEGRYGLKYLSLDKIIILKWILRGMYSGYTGLRMWSRGGLI
jgi:hypothetical protein